MTESYKHEDVEILTLTPSKFVKLIEFLETRIHDLDEALIIKYSNQTGISKADLIGLHSAYGYDTHGTDFTEKFKQQYFEVNKVDWDQARSTKDKKTFDLLRGWKDYVLDQGFRYKLKSPSDKYEWVAFSDDDDEIKGMFHSHNDDDTHGDGWAISS